MSDEPNLNDERTSALGLARYAFEYIEAALIVDDRIGQRKEFQVVAPIPALYLAGHGIELSLKAYLRHHDESVRKLQKLGHDLNRCYRRAIELGLHSVIKPHGAEEGALVLLNGLYAAKELEYIRTGMKHFPTFALVSRLAVTLHNAIAPHVGFTNTFAISFAKLSAD